jgi:uncharacterized protein DUF3347
MKNTIFGIAISAISFVACNNDNTQAKDSNQKSADTSQSKVQSPGTKRKDAASVREIVQGYLQLKNALVTDNGKEAANAGKALSESMKTFNKATLNPSQKKAYEDVEGDIKEHAEHIGENGDKIAHQREHFEMLSKDIYDFVKTFGAGQTLYKDYCPMYNDKKGANWISETKEIKNPYLGKKMPTCGTVKEVIN